MSAIKRPAWVAWLSILWNVDNCGPGNFPSVQHAVRLSIIVQAPLQDSVVWEDLKILLLNA